MQSFRPDPMDAMHPGLQHVREVLGMIPLHARPLPIAAWRLLMDFAAAERSFFHNIIQHYHDTSVFMCVARGSSSPAPTASIPDAAD